MKKRHGGSSDDDDDGVDNDGDCDSGSGGWDGDSDSSGDDDGCVCKSFTRTAGFYKNHPDITADILAAAGGVSVCGKAITNADVDHGNSALEGMCVTSHGSQRTQLVRQLIAAALNMAAGGATFDKFGFCNALCQNTNASKNSLSACTQDTEAYNQKWDHVPAPFDPPGPADSNPCADAFDTDCTVLNPGPCALP